MELGGARLAKETLGARPSIGTISVLNGVRPGRSYSMKPRRQFLTDRHYRGRPGCPYNHIYVPDIVNIRLLRLKKAFAATKTCAVK